MFGKQVFISYAKPDTDRMRAVVARCRSRNYNCWVDESGLVPGTPSWQKRVEQAIEEATCLVVLLSPASKSSEWVRLEVSYAKQFGLNILPILVSGDNRTAVPIGLTETQYADATQNFEMGVDVLLKSLGRFHAGHDPYATEDAISFLNYRRRDTTQETKRIYDRMTDHFGRNSIFLDVDSIPLGVDFRQLIENVVSKSKSHLFVIGPEWLDVKRPDGSRCVDDPKDLCRIEAEAAIVRGVPLVAALIRGATLPSEESLPPSLVEVAYSFDLPVRKDQWDHDLNRLLKTVAMLTR
jgi:TIR domain